MKLFAQLTKVDVEKREVHGRATQEIPDKSGEICDYASSKPLFEAWSKDFEKATDGKSLGNVRAMHQKDRAVGKLTAIDFNDAEKAIDVVAKIIDDQDWEKVQEGVYTGFSIGGEYAKRWKDPADQKMMRFTAAPGEISLVDDPCLDTARFTMVKAAGVTEERAFKAPPAEPVAKTEEKPALAKSLYSVSDLASVLSTVRYLALDSETEKEWERDDSPIPEQLRSWLSAGAAILVAMAEEEVTELVASVQPPEQLEVEVIALSAKTGELSKSLLKAKSSKSLIQKVHDHSVALGAGCGDMDKADKAAPTGELAKVSADLTTARSEHEALAKKADDLTKASETLTKQVGELTAERDTLQKRVTELERLPAADPKGVQRLVTTVSKADDNRDAPADDEVAALEKLVDKGGEAVSLALMKAAQKRGTHMGTRPAVTRPSDA